MHTSATPEQTETLTALRVKEFELALDSPEPYEAFRLRAERVRDDLLAMCRQLHGEGKRIHVYGASTKGNTILQYAGIDNGCIEAAADRDPDKYGSETIATKILIISEEDSRAMSPDYYLALPWHFLDEFLEREQEFLKRGGKFIVPLPEVRIVGGSSRFRRTDWTVGTLRTARRSPGPNGEDRVAAWGDGGAAHSPTCTSRSSITTWAARPAAAAACG